MWPVVCRRNWSREHAMEQARNKPDVTGIGKGERETGAVSALAREDWIGRYTERILRAWFQWEGPLGLAESYANWIRRELSAFHGQPLMKAFIERTFRGDTGREM